MILVFLGKQFVGKGTYAQNVAEKFGGEVISTGDIVRAEIRSGSELGRRIGETINAGNYLDNATITGLLEKKLDSVDSSKGIVFDGYPRSLEQAKLLDQMLAKRGTKIGLAINFTGDEETLLSRATTRRTCKKCNKIYNLKTNPPKVEGACDACGGELFQREDDKPEAIRKRFAQHDEKTGPILGYYREKHVLEEIDGSRPIPAVNADVEKLLKEKFKS